ncbi:MAG: S41 family peptidase [Patescibacteria group bacterium]
MNRYQKPIWIVGAVAAAGAVFVFGTYVGYEQSPSMDRILSVAGKKEPPALSDQKIDFEPFWKAWRMIEEKYVTSDGLDRQKMVWGAVAGMAESLDDPYTVFFPPAEKEIFDSEIRGDFEGVGMEIGIRKGTLTVIAPLKGTPSYKAGIKAGDKIIKIDDKISSDLTLDEAVRLIRGKKGTEVVLAVLRGNEDKTREIKVVRDVIQIPLLETESRASGIFIIRLFSFSEKSPLAFRQALRQMVESGADKIIIDFRNNPGGFLEAAVDIASWFLPPGKVVVKEDFGKGQETIHRSRGYNVFNNVPVVILVNGGSASASEIVAGALQDYGIARLVGAKTFGKGSVQEMVPITAETALKVTIARWLTPLGRSISENGLAPDVAVEGASENESAVDPQLDKAIEILLNK